MQICGTFLLTAFTVMYVIKKIQVMMWVGRKTFFIHIQIFVSNFAYVKNSFIVETNVYLTLKFPDLATDDEGNEGFWTLIYNQVL